MKNMMCKINIGFLIVFCVFLCGCTKEYDNPADKDNPFSAPAAIAVSETGVNQIKISWEYKDTEEEGFQLIISGRISKEIDIQRNVRSYVLTDIFPGTYHFRICAFTGDRQSEFAECSYNMTSDQASFKSWEVSEVTANTFNASFEVITGELKVFEKGLCWSTGAIPSIQDNSVIIAENNSSYSGKGLLANTVYQIRPFVKCNNGIYYGEVRTIRTYRQNGDRIILKIKKKTSDPQMIRMNIQGNNVSVDWGDGSYEDLYNGFQLLPEHTYQSENATVIIYGTAIYWLLLWNKDHLFEIVDADFSHAPQLEEIYFEYCQITSVDLSRNNKLRALTFNCCNLEELDVSLCQDLIWLTCPDNFIRTVSLGDSKQLKTIDCSNNQMDACSLNDLFRKIPVSANSESGLTIKGNSGARFSDTSIASGKGWKTDITGNASVKCE